VPAGLGHDDRSSDVSEAINDQPAEGGTAPIREHLGPTEEGLREINRDLHRIINLSGSSRVKGADYLIWLCRKPPGLP
jgi:hypothetical protein